MTRYAKLEGLMNLTMPWKAKTETPINVVSAKLGEIREALGSEADHLAQVAAQYGRDAGKLAHETTESAAHVARDPAGSASGLAQSLLKGASEIGSVIAASGRKTAAELGHDAQAAATELRKVRLTTEPKKTSPDFMPGITLLAGFGAGIALMYFADPEQGRRRRALLRDQLTKWTRVTRETAAGKAKDLSNRAAGAANEARKAVGVPVGEPDYEIDRPTGNGYEPSDASTTDTWGEQTPLAEESRIG
jgi:hypothetical protein